MLKSISLQNFRSYKKAEFNFSGGTTIVIGPNTSGKTNFIEAIFLLSTGKSFRTDKDTQMISFREDLARVKARVGDPSANSGQVTELEVIITNGQIGGKTSQYKKFLVNGVSKRRVDFAENLTAVLFSPEDLEIIVDSPSLRRKFLDSVLEQVDREYRLAVSAYTKALRQRNALLENARETGVRNEKQFEYWDNLVIENGELITKKREEFINFVNNEAKDIFDFVAFYDKSVISKQRLLQYKEAEVASGVTLVGPHRDDFSVSMFNPSTSSGQATTHDIKFYGSRGQQRLTILQLKMLELLFVEKKLGQRPVLILDDIFSELDEGHIKLILEMINLQQTIITTTHKEFIPANVLNKMQVLHFSKEQQKTG
ncbi:MAG: DNA replication and repair protein RecF [Patescibacteria group bacterium]|nr:DNA replication and repair protein RecF [Patescibacteria group bacterium]